MPGPAGAGGTAAARDRIAIAIRRTLSGSRTDGSPAREVHVQRHDGQWLGYFAAAGYRAAGPLGAAMEGAVYKPGGDLVAKVRAERPAGQLRESVPDFGGKPGKLLQGLAATGETITALAHGDLIPASILADGDLHPLAVLGSGFLSAAADPAFDAAVTATENPDRTSR